MFFIVEKMAAVFSFLGRKPALFAAAVVSLMVAADCASAAPGDLDPTFGANGLATLTEPGYVGPFYAVAIQPDGKIVAAGSGVVPYSSSAPYLVRFNDDGCLDSSFGSGGIVLIDPWGTTTLGLAFQPDGKILASLNQTVQRYSVNGVLETTFPSNLQACVYYGPCIFNIVIQPDEKILVATATGLVRYNSDGTYDTGFGSGGISATSYVYIGMALQSDGKIVAAGNSFGDMLVSRYNADGTLDPAFGNNGSVIIPSNNQGGFSAVSVQPDGKIITTSRKYVSNYPAPTTYFIVLMRFNADGTLDSTFGSGGVVETPVSNEGYGLANTLQPDGKIIVTGQVLGQGLFVARYNTDGSPDTQFGAGGVVTTGPGGVGNAVALQADGKIVVAGYWADNSSGGPTVARYLVGDTVTPEAMLEALIKRVESFNLKQKISNKLDAKLKAALDALEAAKKHSVAKACKKLDDFLKKVQAQSGKGLTVDQAGQLVCDTNRVEELLGCH